LVSLRHFRGSTDFKNVIEVALSDDAVFLRPLNILCRQHPGDVNSKPVTKGQTIRAMIMLAHLSF
jgi:hypothetical protein